MKHMSHKTRCEHWIDFYMSTIRMWLPGARPEDPLTGICRREVRWAARMAARQAFDMRPDLRENA